MILRLALFVLLAIFIARAFWRLFEGIVDGATGGRAARTGRGEAPRQGVQMVRDPVCGTFLVPGRAVALVDGRTHVFFCSDACRDKYRRNSA